MISFKVVALAEHPHHWQQAAEWSFAAWQHEFPSDTVQTYLEQFALAATKPKRLLEIFAAISDDDQLLGLATLVDDDELPDAPSQARGSPRFSSDLRQENRLLVRHSSKQRWAEPTRWAMKRCSCTPNTQKIGTKQKTGQKFATRFFWVCTTP